MTLVVSYWSSQDMAWLDGNSSKARGLCQEERPDACPARVSFGNFSVQDVHAKEEPAAPGRGSCDCPAARSPVCGMDGKTYNSSCAAVCSGVTVHSAGRCPGHSIPLPSGASDGPSTTWMPAAETVAKLCPTAAYEEQEGAFLEGAFPVGTGDCPGGAECQFRTRRRNTRFATPSPTALGCCATRCPATAGAAWVASRRAAAPWRPSHRCSGSSVAGAGC
ncbi:unnamed protein product [Prorocentrum cordatum]|uniref:Kazal-like domain-containing protein n=1 Tax=Prorocentrum cordatum TaxID=2364126 RepID=A0ABN9SZ49_9DINO|nr:unnamed protein product [Polarella glacialis]